MRDLIDRQAAIDELIRKMRPHDNGDGTITICVMSEGLVRETLNNLPSAQQRWIPVAERLPEDAADVIATTSDGDVRPGWYDAKKGWCVNYNYWPNAFDFIAWMPLALPDPYTED